MSPPDDRPLRETDRPRARSRWFPGQRTRAGGSAPLRPPCQPPAVRVAAEAPATMFNQQLQQQQLQQQQLLQLQQLLQQSPPQAPLPMAVSRGLPQQQPQQQLLNLQGANSASLLNGSVLQRALLLQQLQGNLRGYSLATPNLTPPSLTPPQLATPNLQQFFPQATRQSLLGPPPVGVPMNPSQINLSGRTPQKQARAPTSSTPHRKTTPMEDESDPPEGSEEAVESRTNMPKDQGSPPCPDDIMKEKRTLAPTPESCEASEPPAKRSKSSELPTEKGPPGQLQAKVPPRARTTAPKQTQTPELLPEPPEARVLPRFQPRVLQIQAQVQPQTPPLTPPVDTPARHQPQKQAQTQTSPEHVGPRPGQEGVGPQKQARPQAPSQAPGQVQTQLQKQAQTQTYPQVQPPDQPRGHPPAPSPGQPPDQTEGRLQPPPRVPVPTVEPAPELLPDKRDTAAGPEKASPEPGGAQVSMESQDELTGGLDVGECEKRAREMLGVWGAGGSLKVTILQSSDSRAFSTIPITPVPRAGDSASTAPAAASTPSKQTLQFFCYLCKANCSSQQEFQNHMSGTQHQQRLGELQHTSQACLLSLLPVPRDVLEREDEEPPPRRWCNTCQLYYMGDLIQHRRTQDHKIAKQSLRPFCTICNRYFKTPRKFVEHVKSQGHKDKAEELKMLEKETAGQDEDHFITVDAVGCFEGDEEEEEDDDDEEEEIEVEEEFCKQVRSRDISIEEWKGSETYSPNTAYGVDFLVPVMGYMCRICHKFYHSNSGAQLSHCKSLAHFENLQKYKKAKNPSPTSRPMSRRCAINARNALTALFTSGGRTPTQPSTQDPAKTPSKPRSPEPTFGISQSRPEPYSPALPRLPNPARKSTAQKSSGQTPRPRPESRPL
ncbi:cip1-interacting zinc finger protein isoform X5 [Mustela lutreola]|uniref:cip1-interacting zinc finger protein isoform X5 n=1 Tax=Mustela lutreola TaxID=9666 RepID=UPI002797A334|nr:cip1-interacting zinc finger protein isoform X5 [Mustela lutreola]